MSDNARIMCRRLPTLLAAVSSIMMLALILCACGDGYASNPEDKEADPATVEPRIHAMVGNAADCFDQGHLHEAFRILKDAETILATLSPEEAARVATRDMFLLEVYIANIYSNYRDFACAARYYGSAMEFAASARDSLQTLLNISVMSSHSGDSLLAARSARRMVVMVVADKEYQKYAVAVALAAFIWLLWRRAIMSQRRIFFLNREIARQEAVCASDPADINATSQGCPAIECGDMSPSPVASRHSDMMRSVHAALADPAVYCDPEFSITVLARLVGSNSKYVSQAINDSTGMNFRTFINSLRIKVARTRLAGNCEYENMTIQAISESVGFRSTSNFVLAFKKVMGITPSAYQKLAKNSIDS